MDCSWLGWCSLTASEQAAWVQAIGSVAAIAAAIGIAAYERQVAKGEAAERRRLEENGRYTHANRAMTRFKKVIARQLEAAKTQQTGNSIHPMPIDRVPDEMRDLERECSLIRLGGGDCLTAISFFEESLDLLTDSLLMPENAAGFIELLEYADSRIDVALKHFFDYLNVAYH
ncbi:hypothetical protein [Stenotrophomonas tumulicola]|uniref:Uncharacterized protein n=1 Tax=Stenotrophomonas tumulicola TaxID=1685415 RepID=A0A7W3IG22_9GAMM|nr:hypothetical protein [Stenotrophomonas tumulicola]MBA8680498.1 hypothetical protein [Stenotrophomonas tumulicola]